MYYILYDGWELQLGFSTKKEAEEQLMKYGYLKKVYNFWYHVQYKDQYAKIYYTDEINDNGYC